MGSPLVRHLQIIILDKTVILKSNRHVNKRRMIGIIFDLDGTLWNTSSICAEAWNKAISLGNIQKTPLTEDDIARVSGLPFMYCVKNLFPDIGESLQNCSFD